MTTIIAASDLTERSQQVPGRALALAEQLGARVVLVHVASSGAPALVSGDARRRMQEQLDETPVKSGAEVEIRVLNGRPEIELPDLVETESAELIVLGLHRVRPVLDLLRLTTMERIVLRSAAPALIAHIPAAQPYRKVLAATDFAPACAAALACAARIAPDAELHAIHALQLPLFDKFRPSDVEHSRAMTRAESLRDAFLRMPGVPATLEPPEIVAGGVHELLAMLLEELSPDLLAIGSQSGRNPMTLGNYARDLMREPPIDVLVANPPQQR